MQEGRIMISSRLLVAGVLLCAVRPAIAHGSLVTIHDQSFTPGTWDGRLIGGTNATGAALFQEPGGVTGNAQRTQVTGSGSFTFDVEQYKNDADFDPAIGSIDSIGYEMWCRVTGASEFASFQLAARQGGGTFRAPATFFEPPIFSTNWQRITGSVSPANFQRMTGSGLPTLDLSPSAPPIEFGYLLSRGVFQSGTTNYRASFFTVDVSYTPVPEPGSAFLTGIAAIALLGPGCRCKSRLLRRGRS
jgi:hypothetical protein